MPADWLPLKIKTPLARVLCAPPCGRLLAVLFRDRIPCRGLTFVTSSPHVTAGAKAKLFWRLYENTEIRFVSKYLPVGVPVVELGSSIGVLSCFIKKRIGTAARLVCVEAHPEFGQIIAQNLSNNHLLANVDIVNTAVSVPGCESVTFTTCPDNVSGRIRPDDVGLAGQTVTVAAASLCRIVSEHGLTQFCLVCDIEGAEATFILGDPGSLAQCSHCIIELHDTTHLGRRVYADELLEALIARAGLSLVDRRGAVCFLRRDSCQAGKSDSL